MKKALVITYYWPPSGGAGVQRWLKFVKYLREFGWEPVIFTPENPEFPETDPYLEKEIPAGIEVIRAPIWEPYEYYKRISGKKKGERIQAAFLSEKKKNPATEKLSVWIRGNLFIPDARKFWIRPATRFLVKYLADHPVNVIVSSGPPHSMHVIAGKVSDKLKIPWLADFRDPWTGIDFYRDLRLTRYADRRHHRLEQEVLRKAGCVTVVGPSMAEDMKAIFPRKYEVVTNGYDPEDVEAAGTIEPDPEFSISHIGTLTGSRNLQVLWTALKQLTDENEDLRKDLAIKLVGKVDFSATEAIRQSGLEGYVSRTEYLPHKDVIRVQKASRVLLLLINDTPNARSILTGKFFEYMASGRPVLCIGPEDGDAAKIIYETRTGLVSGYHDLEKTRNNILALYKDFKKGKLQMESTGVERFSRKALTQRMSVLMDNLAAAK